jgi:hypothetical protein
LPTQSLHLDRLERLAALTLHNSSIDRVSLRVVEGSLGSAFDECTLQCAFSSREVVELPILVALPPAYGQAHWELGDGCRQAGNHVLRYRTAAVHASQCARYALLFATFSDAVNADRSSVLASTRTDSVARGREERSVHARVTQRSKILCA